MKYWNKSKRYRLQSWTNISIHGNNQGYIWGTHRVDEAKHWCQHQGSKGRFYFSPYTGWWFELEKDASNFIMKWMI